MSTRNTTQEFLTTTDGEIPDGFLYATVKNIGATEATFNGVPLPPGEAWPYPFVGKPYEPIRYQCNGTTLRIRYTH